MKNLDKRSSVAAVVSSIILLSAVATPLLHSQTAPIPAPRSEIYLTVDPVQSKVRYMVDSTLHTVHGTFEPKGGAIHFDLVTGEAGGEVVVLAPTGTSGNGSRDRRMHKEILETAKYPEISFHPTRVEGKVEKPGTSEVKLVGVLSIHGADHEITTPIHAELSADRWHGTGMFDVPYVSWGIKDPSNFLLKVKPVVHIELDFSGDIKPAQ